MAGKSPYPLLSLKLLGSICPCLEREEDAPARHAAWALSSVPIRWHRRLRPSSSAPSSTENKNSSGMTSFISGIFGGANVASAANALSGNTIQYEPLESASLSVVDSKLGPLLLISPPASAKAVRDKRIPLKVAKTAQAFSGGIIGTLVGSRSGICIIDSSGTELVRFDLLKRNKTASSTTENSENDEDGWQDEEGGAMETGAQDATEKMRDDLVDQLQILLEWERRRQDYLESIGDESTNATEDFEASEFDDDGESTGEPVHRTSSVKRGGIIAERARKIQHFAQREIEMQKTKREREDRKARYVKEAGGLKYTAIAMANRN